MRQLCYLALILAICHLPSAICHLHAGDWSHWRGPEQNGVSREKNLPDKFDVLWKMPHGGRSTPIVQNGRVYVINHSGAKGINEQERVMCFDADSGKVMW